MQELQSNGSQYVTEYSDDNSAERLLQAMQQANFAPQVVDWFSEEYSSEFAQQTSPESNGDLVLMSATAGYDDASANPGLQLMESWLNRVAGPATGTRTSSPSWPGRPAWPSSRRRNRWARISRGPPMIAKSRASPAGPVAA